MRLDLFLAEKYNISRNKAQFAITENKVKINGILVKKPGFLVKESDVIDLIDTKEMKYVARSAFKLEGVLQDVSWDLKNAVCLDIWASTWGFSQILLEHDVAKIYAVDVWTSQLHESIRLSTKVISIENTDIRDFAKHPPHVGFDYIVCDVSFIRLELILESILKLAAKHTKMALLYKPQYEVGKGNLNKKWVPKNERIVQEQMMNFLLILKEKWLDSVKIFLSKLEGENGNREYFIIIE